MVAEICAEITEHDDMLVAGQLDHYMSVGRSAIDLITLAMLAAHKDRFSCVLDLPCGGGRVTRHLKAFLPDSRLFVGDLDKQKEAFATATFGATAVDPGADFSIPAADRFDLAFVGSLLTHFGPSQYQRTLRWFIDALMPDGLLLFTTHGRRTFHKHSADFQCEEWRDGVRGYGETGFGYRPYDPAMPMDGPFSYGTSLSAPHWVARLIERDPEVRIIHLAEGSWADNQDTIILQKRPLTGE